MYTITASQYFYQTFVIKQLSHLTEIMHDCDSHFFLKCMDLGLLMKESCKAHGAELRTGFSTIQM